MAGFESLAHKHMNKAFSMGQYAFNRCSGGGSLPNAGWFWVFFASHSATEVAIAQYTLLHATIKDTWALSFTKDRHPKRTTPHASVSCKCSMTYKKRPGQKHQIHNSAPFPSPLVMREAYKLIRNDTARGTSSMLEAHLYRTLPVTAIDQSYSVATGAGQLKMCMEVTHRSPDISFQKWFQFTLLIAFLKKWREEKAIFLTKLRASLLYCSVWAWQVEGGMGWGVQTHLKLLTKVTPALIGFSMHSKAKLVWPWAR